LPEGLLREWKDDVVTNCGGDIDRLRPWCWLLSAFAEDSSMRFHYFVRHCAGLDGEPRNHLMWLWENNGDREEIGFCFSALGLPLPSSETAEEDDEEVTNEEIHEDTQPPEGSEETEK
ncbi:hypothetical protein ADUPG1_005776, partial [Aduncisulcus paluster]